jgi:hypothetical protein
VVYAILLGLPSQEITIQALGLSSTNSPGRIEKVEILGALQVPEWKQTQSGLTIKVPESLSGIPEYAMTVKACLA